MAKSEEIWGYIGEAGKDGEVSGEYRNGTFNGGGSCGSTNAWGNLSTGGGATDIRLVNGDWDNFDSLKSRIMVAGGGGGASRMLGSSWLNINGGQGGTITGGSSNRAVTNRCYLYQSNWWNSNIGGTICQSINNYIGHFGKGNTYAETNTAGAGGGYYGGGTGYSIGYVMFSGAGGSSFISGNAVCNAIAESSTESEIVHTGSFLHYSGKYFLFSKMLAGNETMPNPNGNGTMNGNSGNGCIKITQVYFE